MESTGSSYFVQVLITNDGVTAKSLKSQITLVLANELAKNGYHIELEQTPKAGLKRRLQRTTTIGSGPLECLNRLNGFDAEIPAFLQRLPVIASVSHGGYKCTASILSNSAIVCCSSS